MSSWDFDPYSAWNEWASSPERSPAARALLHAWTEDEIRTIVRQELAELIKIDVPDAPPES